MMQGLNLMKCKPIFRDDNSINMSGPSKASKQTSMYLFSEKWNENAWSLNFVVQSTYIKGLTFLGRNQTVRLHSTAQQYILTFQHLTPYSAIGLLDLKFSDITWLNLDHPYLYFPETKSLVPTSPASVLTLSKRIFVSLLDDSEMLILYMVLPSLVTACQI